MNGGGLTQGRYKRVSFALALLVAVGMSFPVLTILPTSATAITHFVGGSGPDNFTAIQDAIDFANPGDIVYVFQGTYVENVIVYKTLSMIGEDRNSTVIDGSGLGITLHVTADWVNVTGFTVNNSGINPIDSGIELDGVQHCHITNNIASDNGYKGLALEYSDNNTITNNEASLNYRVGISLRFSHNNTVINNNATRNNGTGIGLGWSDNNTVQYNTALNNKYSGIGFTGHTSLRGFSNTVTYNLASGNMYGAYVGGLMDTVSSNTLTNNMFGILFEGGFHNVVRDNNITENTADGIFFIAASSYNIVQANDISRNGASGIYMDPVMIGNNTIIDNEISMNFFSGITALELHHNTITNNRITGNGAEGIAVLTSSIGNQIAYNTISSNAGSGIYFGPPVVAFGNSISGNTISFNVGSGVNVLAMSNSTIVGNDILSNDFEGVALITSDKNTVSDNNIVGNGVGICLDMVSVGNIIERNTVSDSHASGIGILDSSNNTIANNKVSSNLRGISLQMSSNNRIYHNVIVDNSVQALDDSFDNLWDDGYPSGGNLWSDYIGIDQNSGPNQDQPGSDGIGDTPYVIDMDSQDRYPFFNGSTPLRPPENINAFLSSASFSDVTITWDLSPDDGSSSHPILTYDVYRNESYHSSGEGYALLGSVVAGMSSYVDMDAGEGDPLNYFYIVCAVDNLGESACTVNQAAKFTRSLSKGPNLVSIPLNPSNTRTGKVFQTVLFDKVWIYDSFTDTWKSFTKLKPYLGQFTTVAPIMGIWINVTEDSNLTVAGIVPKYSVVYLHTGWNLVGFPCFKKDYSVAMVKTIAPVERVEGFDGLTPPYLLKNLTQGDFFIAGYGYWLMSENDAVWSLDNL